MGEAEIYAIEAAQIALVKAGSPQVERLARSRYAHHAASLQTLKLAALAAGAAYPTSLDAKGRERIEALWGAEGPAFDQLFLRQMKAIERETATARGEFLATGRDQYLRRFASAPTPGSGQADVATGPIQRGAVEGA
jgi:predicted outer membrane protein